MPSAGSQAQTIPVAADPFAGLIQALRDPGLYPADHFAGLADACVKVELLETHISCVLLAGNHAYKIKKPVNLGFLDFTSLAARRLFCEEELRLNRRTAASLYREVIAITGSAARPVLGGDAPPIEYAVRMTRFGQDALLDSMARNGTLVPDCIDALAQRVAEFHQAFPPASATQPFGSASQILTAALQNFDQMQVLAGASHSADAQADADTLARLRDWTTQTHAKLAGLFEQRKRDGFVRECHGDLHLGNIVMLEGVPTPFDCIEFNAAFRWIDVMNEVAFLVMDLQEHGLAQLAFRFLNRYLEASGDYAGLQVLRFYIVYRALVRAKVACIRSHQSGIEAKLKVHALAQYRHYLAFAKAMSADGGSALVLMHGLSGSGKSRVARQWAESLRAVQLRSDVERKRLHGLAPLARTGSAPGAGIYTSEDTERTYDRLADLALTLFAAGYPVIIDAAFLAGRHRTRFRDLARQAGVPFVIASCSVPPQVLQERVARRHAKRTNASEAGPAVLDQQLSTSEPLTADESADVLALDGRDTASASLAAIGPLTRRLGLKLQ